MERAAARGLRAKPIRVPAHLGADEKTVGQGQDYVTVVSDLDRSTVEYGADERRQASLDSYFDKFTPEQLEGIEAVVMDMWDPYANSVRTHLANAHDKIVFDPYAELRITVVGGIHMTGLKSWEGGSSTGGGRGLPEVRRGVPGLVPDGC